ncbi:MAG: hypothetical protein D6772_00560, partial [Bacteroidetes bacterium]
HSLLQLPFGTLTPDVLQQEIGKRRYSRKKIDLIRSLDLLIIDEISMVRADVLDAIDAVLRRLRRPDEPFGGLQLLMIGDLHQLPPVVLQEEWHKMQQHYRTPYFFGSLALQQAAPTVIQLTHIYRQSDSRFIALLNQVRHNKLDSETLALLHTRYQPDFRPRDDEGYITLSSHNRTTRTINQEKLAQLPGQAYTFKATLTGDFPESMYPNTPELTFKVGAQVMFNKNDTYPDRLYYNGKIGIIKEIFGDEIVVSCPGEEPITVFPVTWENRKYELNSHTKQVEEKVVGTYEQHPLKLAWAITIHKSQGLTFDKVIIDAQSAFAHGQVYVALSRCKTFEGIVLRTPIELSSVRTDSTVRAYSDQAAAQAPTAADLHADKLHFQADCLRELFNFSKVEGAARWLLRALLEHERVIQGDGLARFRDILSELETKAVQIGNKFLPQLEIYFREGILPCEHPELSERLEGAVQYFLPYLDSDLLPKLDAFDILTDNQSVRQQVADRLHKLRLLVYTKIRLFQAIQTGFDATEFIQASANASIDFEQQHQAVSKTPRLSSVPKDLPNRALYLQLVKWRQAKAEELHVPAYAVAANKALLEVVQVLPTTEASLLRVRGFGKKRVATHGKDILKLIRTYVEEHELTTDLVLEFATKPPPTPPKPAKPNTRQVTLDLFQTGKSPAEIAAERELKETTILGHLTYWIGKGVLPLSTVVTADKEAIIRPYLEQHRETSLGEVFQYFDGKYSYAELRAVRQDLERGWQEEE